MLPLKVLAIYQCSIDGDSWLAYSCKAIAADVPAALRWIDAHPLPSTSSKPAHPLMVAPHWAFFGSRAEVDLLDEQSQAGDFGYVVEETDVV